VAVKYPLSLVVQAVDKATGALGAFNRRMRKLLQPVRVPLQRLGNRLTALAEEAGLPRLMEGFKGVGTALGKVGGEVFALGKRLLAMGAVAGAVFFGFTRSAVDAGDELATVADRLGVTVDWLAQTRFAAEQADVPAEKFANAMDTLSKRLGEAKAGGGQLLGFLQKVSPALAGQVRGAASTEEAFDLMVGAFSRVEDPARRAALEAAAFGRGAVQMGAFVGQGSDAIEAQRKRFLDLSGSQERFARGAGDLDNAVRESRVAFLGLRNTLAGELFPALTELARAVTGVVAGSRQSLAEWAREAGAALSAWIRGGGLQRVAQGLREVFDFGRRLVERLGGWKVALVGVAAVVAGPLLGAMGGLISSVITLGAAIGFTPVGWILAALVAIAAIAVVVWRNFDRIKAVLVPAFAPALPPLRELGAQLRRLWEVVAPVLLPALQTLGKVAGAVLVVQLQNAGKVLSLYVGLMARWVGFLADVATGAINAGKAVAQAFTAAWEKVRPVAEAVSRFATPAGAAIQAGRAAVNWISGGDRTAAGRELAAVTGGGGETRVTVDFSNLPRGVRVAADPRGTAPLDLGVGYSMATP
jgi:hypothetical protein